MAINWSVKNLAAILVLLLLTLASCGESAKWNTSSGIPASARIGKMTPELQALLAGLSPQRMRQIQIESGFNPDALGPKRKVGGKIEQARGLPQILPSTAANPGYGVKPLKDWTPKEQLRFYNDYQDALERKYGDQATALMAYNWGPGNVNKWIKAGKPADKVPAETRNYVQQILGKGVGDVRESPTKTKSQKQVSDFKGSGLAASTNFLSQAKTGDKEMNLTQALGASPMDGPIPLFPNTIQWTNSTTPIQWDPNPADLMTKQQDLSALLPLLKMGLSSGQGQQMPPAPNGSSSVMRGGVALTPSLIKPQLPFGVR